MTAANDAPLHDAEHEPLIGFATLARMAHNQQDLGPIARRLLERAQADAMDHNALMDLATVLHLLGKRAEGLSTQRHALAARKVYRLEPSTGRSALRLLALMTPGDLSENTGIECLVEGGDITLDMLYLSADLPPPAALPEHDVAFVAICESERNRPLLETLEPIIAAWPRPVLNRPSRIARLSREGASRLLTGVPGTLVPLTHRLARTQLEQVCAGEVSMASLLGDGDFPVIVRPLDAHRGVGLARVEGAAELGAYLAEYGEEAFCVARFVDYRGTDGLYRKCRVALIAGRPYACHMALSEHWIVHYLNAGMLESAAKRTEEARFMETFDSDFGARHGAALRALGERIELDYVTLDLGETPDGRLLVFEADSAAIVHNMDPPDVFPYKPAQMRKVLGAFQALLAGAARRVPSTTL